MYICPHVHLRDEEEAYKETIAHGLLVATQAGFEAVIDMPNNKRQVVNRERVRERLNLAQRAREANSKIVTEYHVHVGLTADPAQLEEAVYCYNEIPEVAGQKLFAGRSIGTLAVIKEDEQKFVFKRLTELGYKGPVVIHAEKEQYMNVGFFDPKRPITHALSRPPLAAIASVKDMIDFSGEAGFQGHLHIAHVSLPDEVYLVQQAKKQGRRISCGVTPHHFMLDESYLRSSDGLLYKMNPPLRSKEEVRELRACVLAGLVDLAENDHAVHSLEEKTNPPYFSGMPSLWMYPHFVKWLGTIGMELENEREPIDVVRFTFGNANKIFGKHGKPLVSEIRIKHTWPISNEEYPMDPRRFCVELT